MTTRRELLGQAAGALAGIAFTGCGLTRGAAAQTSGQARRREVVVAGKRVTTVDIHAHCHIPEALELAGQKVRFPKLVITPERIKVMDEQGIDIEALSINPNFWDRAERDLQAQIVKLQNEKVAEICGKTPDRFVGLASVALAYPDLAAEQLQDAVKRLGMRGALVGGSVNGTELSDPKLNPFWAKAEELGIVIFILPQGSPELEASGRLKGGGGLEKVIGNPLETTIALSHLIFEGTLDRFPGIKICAAHGGGFLPSYANRSDAVIKTFPNRVGPLPKKPPTAYIRDGQLFFDSIMFTGEGMRHLIAEAGIDHVLLGTDYPFPWNTGPVDHIMAIPDLSAEDRIKILGATAAKLLGIA